MSRNLYRKYLNHFKKARLETEERRAIRDALLVLTEQMPANVRIQEPNRQIIQRRMLANPLRVLARTPFTSLIVVFIVLSAGGTSLAAADTLPGDTLYPLKIYGTETVRSVFRLSAADKARWEINRAERRLIEAERLALSGSLTARERAQLADAIGEHASRAVQYAKRLEHYDKNNQAMIIYCNLETLFNTHSKVLSALYTQVPAMAMTSLTDILLETTRTVKNIHDEHVLTESLILSGTEDDIRTAANNELQETDKFIAFMHRYIESHKSGVGDSVYQYSLARLAVAGAALVLGKNYHESRDYRGAYTHFHEARQVAEKARMLITTATALPPSTLLNVVSQDMAPEPVNKTTFIVTVEEEPLKLE